MPNMMAALPNIGGALCSTSQSLANVHYHSAVHQPFDHNRHRTKILRGCAPLELGRHLTQCCQCRGLPACKVSSWPIGPFGHNTPTLQTGQTWQDRTDNGPIA